MILNIAPIRKLDVIKDKLNIFKVIYMTLIRYSSFKKLEVDRENLDKFFLTKYPRLIKTEEKDCIGCSLCVVICPTKSIEIELPKMVDFPVSLKFGERPRKFDLDLAACIKCTLCAKVCPVNVLEMDFTTLEIGKVSLL